MTKNDSELAAELENWFKNNADNPNKWNRNKVGQIIKSYLIGSGNWKNAARGNPAKGRRIALENKAKRVNW